MDLQPYASYPIIPASTSNRPGSLEIKSFSDPRMDLFDANPTFVLASTPTPKTHHSSSGSIAVASKRTSRIKLSVERITLPAVRVSITNTSNANYGHSRKPSGIQSNTTLPIHEIQEDGIRRASLFHSSSKHSSTPHSSRSGVGLNTMGNTSITLIPTPQPRKLGHNRGTSAGSPIGIQIPKLEFARHSVADSSKPPSRKPISILSLKNLQLIKSVSKKELDGADTRSCEETEKLDELTKLKPIASPTADYLEYLKLSQRHDSQNFIHVIAGDDDLVFKKVQRLKVIGTFLMGDKIGKGAFGKVKEGICTESLQRIAVKIIGKGRAKKGLNGIAGVMRYFAH